MPSRVRSPTPANTEKPPFSTAVIRISSWMSTVLPTPAPPKRPILPPFAKGHSRSTTLMPVSKTSDTASCSSKLGAGRWIGQRVSPAASAAHPGRPCRAAAEQVEDAALGGLAHGHRDRRARCRSRPCRGCSRRSTPWRRSARRRCRGAGRPRARGRCPCEVVLDLDGVVDGGQVAGLEAHVDHGAEDLGDGSNVAMGSRGSHGVVLMGLVSGWSAGSVDGLGAADDVEQLLGDRLLALAVVDAPAAPSACPSPRRSRSSSRSDGWRTRRSSASSRAL